MAVLGVLAGCLLLAASQSLAAAQTQPAASAPATGPAASQPAGAKSPKEMALAEFLKAMKLEGQPILIEFGLVGCELSDKGLDSMIALQKANAVPGLAMVRVEAGTDDAAVKKYFDEKAPPFPVHRDSQSTLAKALSATAFPTFVLVDKFGHIRYTGKYPQDDLVPWAKVLAAETKDPGSNVAPFGSKKLNVEMLLSAKLPDLKGNPKSLSELMAPNGLMLLFVDTGCPFSAAALKEMPMVSKALAQQKINAVVVNSDDAAEKVQAFYAKNDPGVPVLYDTGKTTREQWNVQSVPIAVYVSPVKTIAYQGEAVWANMGKAIESSLALPPGTIKFTAAGTGFG